MTALPLLSLAAAVLLVAGPNREVQRLSWLLRHRGGRSTIRDLAVVARDARRGQRLLDRLSVDRRRRMEQGELRRAVAAVIEESRAGATPAQAFASAAGSGSFADFFAVVAEGASTGEPVPFPHDPAEHLAALTLACRVNSTTGMPLVGALSGVAADLKADHRLRLAVDRAVSGPRSSAVLLALLPVLGVAMGEAMGVHPASLLVRSSIGRLLLGAGIGFDLAGLLWTRALVGRVRR